MKIYEGLESFKRLPKAIVTSGTFDGVHIGHQQILAKLSALAKKEGGETVVITFWPHPRLVLHPDSKDLKLLSTFEEKATLLARFGVDHLIKIAFTPAFSQLSSSEFIQQILIDAIGTTHLVIGYDHRFGKNREGSFDHLVANKEKYGFEVKEISRQDVDNVGVSSTRIRNALAAGQVEIASEYLGRPYSFNGTVVEGDKIGRKIGFPTANVSIAASYKLIPADGVYAVKVEYEGKQYQGMLNIGQRPTVGGHQRRVEVHIFDLDENLYTKELSVFLIRQIRTELKFDSLDALRAQLHQDKEAAIAILN
ncbi:bifunctional riboflavin kinase/FAD synthetase [Nafulsella turpanensis]|uniref:bifunctional riboflavin kinase/FAD synthetase n=1 Tax=Nafulsella turpanensis TaxID=1265690 RepID=UPI00034C7848|nr:bifunctional riboflavin kinase/FAD synthetase [Nafulsella turpanensis]